MIRTLMLLCMTVCLSCYKPKRDFQVVKDKEMTVEMMLHKPSAADTSFAVQVRIVPVEALAEGRATLLNEQMFYRMDSCFFFNQNGRRVRALSVETVSNGLKGVYEYLLRFNRTPANGPVSIIYQDKYINGKTYTLLFNK